MQIIVRDGETIFEIAQRAYGSVLYWHDIALLLGSAYPTLTSGQVIEIPDTPVELTTAIPVREVIKYYKGEDGTGGGGGGAVDSVFGRTGAVTAQSGDYNADKITETASRVFLSPNQKSKLEGIEAGAQVNVKPDWNASSGAVNEILNKPTIQPSPYKLFSCYKGTQGITGITVNSVFTLGVVTIPANTISAGDWMELTAVFTKYNTGIAQFGISIGSSIALPSVTTQFAGSQATDNNNRILAVERKQIKITANGLIAPNILTTMNDSNLSNPILTITGINWGVVNYIIPYVFNISATTVLANLEAFEVRIK